MHGPVINPEHRAWLQQDQAFLSNFQSSLGNGAAGLVLFASTSMEFWNTLESAFASASTSRSMAIRRELGEIKKLDSSTTVFFNKIKVLADTLASMGKLLSDEEFADFILPGHDQEHDMLAEAVNGAKPPMTPPRVVLPPPELRALVHKCLYKKTYHRRTEKVVRRWYLPPAKQNKVRRCYSAYRWRSYGGAPVIATYHRRSNGPVRRC